MPMPRYKVRVHYSNGRVLNVEHVMGGVPESAATPELLGQHLQDVNVYPGATRIEIEESPLLGPKNLKEALDKGLPTTPKPMVVPTRTAAPVPQASVRPAPPPVTVKPFTPAPNA